MYNIDSLSDNFFCSGTGFLSFYCHKIHNRTPILKDIAVNGFLKKDGTLKIQIIKEESSSSFFDAKNELREKYEFRFNLHSGFNFFIGDMLDDFDYYNLSEDISTYIFNGNILSFATDEKTSFIGRLKKVENIIHFDTSFRFFNTNLEYKKKPYVNSSKEQRISIDLSFQLKMKAA